MIYFLYTLVLYILKYNILLVCDNKERMDNTIICSLNCEGINRSKEFLSDILRIYKCDFICLQELCCLDETLHRVGSISTDQICLFVSSYSQGAEYWIKSDP